MKTAVFPPPPLMTNRLSFSLSTLRPASDGGAWPPPPARPPWPAAGGACWTAASVADNAPTRMSDPRTSIRFICDSKSPALVVRCRAVPPKDAIERGGPADAIITPRINPETSKGLSDGPYAHVELVPGRGRVRGRRRAARPAANVAAAERGGSGADADHAGASGTAPPAAASVRSDADHRPADSTG